MQDLPTWKSPHSTQLCQTPPGPAHVRWRGKPSPRCARGAAVAARKGEVCYVGGAELPVPLPRPRSGLLVLPSLLCYLPFLSGASHLSSGNGDHIRVDSQAEERGQTDRVQWEQGDPESLPQHGAVVMAGSTRWLTDLVRKHLVRLSAIKGYSLGTPVQKQHLGGGL